MAVQYLRAQGHCLFERYRINKGTFYDNQGSNRYTLIRALLIRAYISTSARLKVLI